MNWDKIFTFLLAILLFVIIMIIIAIIIYNLDEEPFARAICSNNGGWLENPKDLVYLCHLPNGSIVNPLEIIENMGSEMG